MAKMIHLTRAYPTSEYPAPLHINADKICSVFEATGKCRVCLEDDSSFDVLETISEVLALIRLTE